MSMGAPSDHPISQAIRAHQSGDIPTTVAILEAFLKTEPHNPDAHHILGMTLTQVGNIQAGLEHLKTSMSLAPDRGDIALNSATVAMKMEYYDQAIEAFRAASALIPKTMDVWTGLGNTLLAMGNIEEAISAYQEGLEHLPENATLNHALGVAYKQIGELDKAKACLQKTTDLFTQNPVPWYNLGNTLLLLHETDSSRKAFERALQLAPNHAETHAHLGLTWMMDGELQRGWPEYEWRWLGKGFPNKQAPFPRWDGSDLSGKTLLLTTEQGFGDAFQFAQFIPQAARRSNARVIVEALPPIADLMKSIPGVDDVTVRGMAPLPQADAQAPLMTLPMILKTRLEDLPVTDAPYMAAPAERIDAWANIFDGVSERKIGLVWRGNPDQLHNVFRSCPAEKLAPVLMDADTTFYILQKDATDEERATLPGAIDLGPRLKDFADTAAAMHHLDLIITVCTSSAHLAGALGKPTWVMLSAASDWRWFLNRDDSPWYPTARLFRQSKLHDWDGVTSAVKAALTDF